MTHFSITLKLQKYIQDVNTVAEKISTINLGKNHTPPSEFQRGLA